MSPRDRSLISVLPTTLAWAGYVFLVLPSLIVVPISFGDKDEFIFPPQHLSLYLYRQYFSGADWMSATAQSVVVAFGATALSLVLGVAAAYGIARYHFRGRQPIALVLLSPIFVPTIVVALGLYLYLGRAGLTGTTFGLIVGHTILTLPFVLVTALAGLRHVDANLETVAMVMGAGRLTVLRRVTLPLLRPAIVAGGLFAFLISFDEVVIAYYLSEVKSQTLPVKMYSTIHWEVSPVLAAISTLLTVLSLAVCLFGALLQKSR